MKLRSVEKIRTRIMIWKRENKRWWKRRSAKLMRQMVRDDPEEAPRRTFIRGSMD
jgi:hypothetical protein